MLMAPPLRARLQASLAGTLALLAAGLALVAWAAPSRYAPVQRALDRLARGIVVGCTWSALGLVYFGVFTPLRLWRDLRGHDPLARKRALPGHSYLRPLPPTPPHFERQF
jgi:hypothetical protein